MIFPIIWFNKTKSKTLISETCISTSMYFLQKLVFCFMELQNSVYFLLYLNPDYTKSYFGNTRNMTFLLVQTIKGAIGVFISQYLIFSCSCPPPPHTLFSSINFPRSHLCLTPLSHYRVLRKRSFSGS